MYMCMYIYIYIYIHTCMYTLRLCRGYLAASPGLASARHASDARGALPEFGSARDAGSWLVGCSHAYHRAPRDAMQRVQNCPAPSRVRARLHALACSYRGRQVETPARLPACLPACLASCVFISRMCTHGTNTGRVACTSTHAYRHANTHYDRPMILLRNRDRLDNIPLHV